MDDRKVLVFSESGAANHYSEVFQSLVKDQGQRLEFCTGISDWIHSGFEKLELAGVIMNMVPRNWVSNNLGCFGSGNVEVGPTIPGSTLRVAAYGFRERLGPNFPIMFYACNTVPSGWTETLGGKTSEILMGEDKVYHSAKPLKEFVNERFRN